LRSNVSPDIKDGRRSALGVAPAAARTTKALGEIFLKNQGLALIDN